MTREEARKAAEVMLAYANGEEIETLCFGEYIPCEDPSFNWVDGKSIKNYRIKPKPRYRPFKTQEECWNEMLKHQPFGWVRSKKCNALLWNITSINKDDITIICDYYKFHRAFECFEFTDGTPFGIKEESLYG